MRPEDVPRDARRAPVKWRVLGGGHTDLIVPSGCSIRRGDQVQLGLGQFDSWWIEDLRNGEVLEVRKVGGWKQRLVDIETTPQLRHFYPLTNAHCNCGTRQVHASCSSPEPEVPVSILCEGCPPPNPPLKKTHRKSAARFKLLYEDGTSPAGNLIHDDRKQAERDAKYAAITYKMPVLIFQAVSRVEPDFRVKVKKVGR